jgi:hypothetical protein
MTTNSHLGLNLTTKKITKKTHCENVNQILVATLTTKFFLLQLVHTPVVVHTIFVV